MYYIFAIVIYNEFLPLQQRMDALFVKRLGFGSKILVHFMHELMNSPDIYGEDIRPRNWIHGL